MFTDKVKDVLGVLALVGLIAGSVLIGHWRDKANKMEAAQDRAVAAERRLGEVIRQAAETARLQATATKEYRDAIASLRHAAASQPVPVIRLCQSSAPAVPGTKVATAGAGDRTATAGQLPPAAEPDVGPALYAEADRGDEYAETLRAIYKYLE
jgi:hypothetical protein